MSDRGPLDEVARKVHENQIHRLDQHLKLQIQGLRIGVENAIEIIKINLLYAGLTLTALSLITRFGNRLDGGDSLFPFVIFSAGFISIIFSIIFAVKIQLSRVVRYPSSQLNSDDVTSYYIDSIKDANQVIASNDVLMEQLVISLRWTLVGLVLGLTLTVVSVSFLLFPISVEIRYGTTLAISLGLGYFVNNIVRGKYDVYGKWGNSP